ncbi:antibiotic biosynthesis monooxygenase [Bacillus sp. MUM 116]|uniref:antibiotic biosynthesis monooxygenase family protein n=1 Tax=Bacillus sp. MUM 116 TaxID=1678002 RepID=UPI0008F57792|nr:antibiotic biosynthesis monooxygenase [Bacillus sp. MUM 116]OIK10103.1 antibiotic biosynthesis monooxygenase [Bacillus sp. MUM 116]
MNIYITVGTYDFLKSIEKKYPSETMITMTGGNGALLLHETNGETVFNEPRKYEVFESMGDIQNGSMVILSNFPVTDEGRPLFEHYFKEKGQSIENEQGFIAFRALRPKVSNTYVILTVWENEASFHSWQNTLSISTKKRKQKAESGIDTQPHMFDSDPYATQYTASK